MDPTLVPNHLASNLVTKGTLNISIIDKGVLVPNAENYPQQYRKRGGGGLAYGYPYKQVDPSAIQLSIDWFKKVPKYKTIGVELADVEKKVKVELIKENVDFVDKDNLKNISVELVTENVDKPKIKIELTQVEIN